MALCILSGTTGWAGSKRNIHPLTPILIINYPLSDSSIYCNYFCNRWHPPYSIYMSDSLFAQILSKFSLVYLLVWHSLLHTLCLSVGKRGDYQNCSVLYCVLKLFTVISTLRWAVLTVLWIGFCHTGPISLCVLHICCIIVSMVGWTWWDWSLILRTYLPSVLWHCWLGHLTRKNASPIWPIMCLVGR